MALTVAEERDLGSSPPEFRLRGVDDRMYQLSDFAQAKALVVAFICNHCPYVIAVQGRVNALAKEYASRGVQLVGINSNDAVKYPDDNFEAMKRRAKEQGFSFPYLWDETQQVAKAYKAVCTPDFFVYERKGGGFALQYRGRLDDSWKDEKAVTRRELAGALDLILAGKNPDSNQNPSMGCSIKWK
jgi:peroxiredoxin